MEQPKKLEYGNGGILIVAIPGFGHIDSFYSFFTYCEWRYNRNGGDSLGRVVGRALHDFYPSLYQVMIDPVSKEMNPYKHLPGTSGEFKALDRLLEYLKEKVWKE